MPGTLWSAFEMYVLTLRGTQMLFFSIVHTMPPLVLVVLLGWIALALWALQSVAALASTGYRAQMGLPVRVLSAVVGAAALHFSLLFFYDAWSPSTMRIAICLLGILAFGLLLAICKKYLLKPGSP